MAKSPGCYIHYARKCEHYALERHPQNNSVDLCSTDLGHTYPLVIPAEKSTPISQKQYFIALITPLRVVHAERQSKCPISMKLSIVWIL